MISSWQFPIKSPDICFNRSAPACTLVNPPFNIEDVYAAAKFLKSHHLAPTPLYVLANRARELGIAALYLKDESAFMGLNAFKGRGAFWAVAKLCAFKLGISSSELSFSSLLQAIDPQSLLFVAATDGNHGAAVAYAAKLLGQRCQIFMPKGSEASRVANIRKYGASCVVTNCNYDGTVHMAASYAKNSGGYLIQDTAWPGYEEIPGNIMQGYATMVLEIIAGLAEILPSHIILQVGVGSFAAAIIGAFMKEALRLGQKMPYFICLEPENAACLYKSLASKSEKPLAVTGSLHTLMAGLACGELSSLAWPILKNHVLATASCADEFATLGSQLLGNPAGNDEPVVSGPSGSPGMGLLHYIMSDKELANKLNLGPNARVLLISTEGTF